MFWFQAHVHGKQQAIAHLVSLLLSSALKILFVVQERPLIWFVVLISFDALLYGIGLLIAYRRGGGRLRNWRFEKPYARNLLKQSWPLFFAFVVTTFYMQIDQLMIKHMLGSAETGLYAAAVRLSSACYAFPWLLLSSIFPALLRARLDDPPLFKRRIRSVYLLLIGMALFLVVPTWLLAGPVVRIIFGPAYAASAGVLVIHIGASLFVFMGSAGDKWLLGEGLQRYTAFNTATGAVVNVLINLWFIPRYGILGAAWATLISQAITYHFALLVFRRTRPVFMEQTRAIVDLITLGPLRRLRRAG
jgi:O-antigen/teichoic acid export membrane protein